MRRVYTLSLTLLVASLASAQTPSVCPSGSAVDTLDANNVRAGLYNNGALFLGGRGALFNVPKALPGQPSVPNAIFSASLLFGGSVGNELRQASASYSSWEYVPGPIDAQGQPPSDCTPYDRIAAVRLSDLQALRQGTVTEAVRSWPWRWGAPVVDGDGVPGNYNLAGGDRPELLGTESHWWVMNAMGSHIVTGSKPFPLEVQVTAFAMPTLQPFTMPIPALNNTVLLRYRLRWLGAAPMTAAYVGFHVDADIGNASDDYIGSDTTLRMGFAYNADNFDEGSDGYGGAPPAIGLITLDGPPLYDDDRDGRAETPGFTSFTYACDSSIIEDCFYLKGRFYQYVRGLNYNGYPFYACGNGVSTAFASCGTTRWLYSGDPVTRAFWSEFKPVNSPTAVANAPSDRRFIMGMGPFTLQPGASQDVVVAFVWARGTDHLDSVTKLKRDARALQEVWRMGGYTTYAQQVLAERLPEARPDLEISAVQPNPMRGTGTITVRVPVDAAVRVWIVDALGRTVARPYDGPMAAGTHAVSLGGAGLGPGVYTVRIGIGGEVVSRPLVVVR